MRSVLTVLVFVFFVFSCDDQLESTEDLKKSTYLLHRAGYEPVKGDVTFTELSPGKVRVEITLINTDEKYDFPAHLHFGAITEVGELAFKLEDVNGANGKSITILDQEKLSNGEIFTFDKLQTMNGSVKIHLNDGLFSQIVLAYGNVGANENYLSDGVTVCTGH